MHHQSIRINGNCVDCPLSLVSFPAGNYVCHHYDGTTLLLQSIQALLGPSFLGQPVVVVGMGGDRYGNKIPGPYPIMPDRWASSGTIRRRISPCIIPAIKCRYGKQRGHTGALGGWMDGGRNHDLGRRQ